MLPHLLDLVAYLQALGVPTGDLALGVLVSVGLVHATGPAAR